MYNEYLKNLDLDRTSLDDMVEYSLIARQLHAEYEQLGVEIPQWLDDRTREIRREVKVRQQDVVDKRLREAKARLAALATPEEKRAKIREEIEALEKLAQGA